MSDSTKAKTTDEVQVSDSLDRREAESSDWPSHTSPPQRIDSAYDQFWLGEESFYLG